MYRRRTDALAAKRGTLAHAAAIAEIKRGLGIGQPAAPAATPSAADLEAEARADAAVQEVEAGDLAQLVEVAPADAPLAPAQVELPAYFAPAAVGDGMPRTPHRPTFSGFAALDFAEREPALEAIAEAWLKTPAHAQGVPLMTCNGFPNDERMRDHHAHWALVYWREGDRVCGAYRCLKCYPQLRTRRGAELLKVAAHA